MHNSADFDAWYQANQRYSSAAFDLVHNILQNFIARSQNDPDAKYSDIDRDRSKLLKIASQMSFPPAFEQIRQRFRLSEFEFYILVFGAAAVATTRDKIVNGVNVRLPTDNIIKQCF